MPYFSISRLVLRLPKTVAEGAGAFRPLITASNSEAFRPGSRFFQCRFPIGFVALAACLLVSTTAQASKPDPDDYPLRVHILKFTTRAPMSREPKHPSDSPDYVSGMGVADLFESGQPSGFQFSYSCIGGLKASAGYANFPARWKKKDKTLEILLPETGRPWNLETCQLQTEMRPGLAFYWRDAKIAEESAAVLKDWMVKHKYDPEKGREEPVLLPGESADDDGTSGSTLVSPE